MEEPIEIVVYGDPVPWAVQQRSMKTGHRWTAARQTEAVAKIIAEVRARDLPLFAAGVPLCLSCEFVVKRPKGHYGSGRNAEVLKEAYVDARPTKRPDLSNLVKLIEDGLVQSNLIPDDDQTVRITAYKRYQATPDERTRTVVLIRALHEPVKSVTIPGMQSSLLEGEEDAPGNRSAAHDGGPDLAGVRGN